MKPLSSRKLWMVISTQLSILCLALINGSQFGPIPDFGVVVTTLVGVGGFGTAAQAALDARKAA